MDNYKERLKKVRRKAPQEKQFSGNRRVYPEFANCEECHGTLYRSDGSVCDCMAEYRIRRKLREANVGTRYFNTNMDFYRRYMKGFDVVFYNGVKAVPDVNVKPISAFIEYLESYVATFQNRLLHGDGFVICGPTGCGKTAATCYIIREVVRQEFSAYYIDTNELLDTIDLSWNSDGDEKRGAYEKLSVLRDVDLLVLDDIGSEYARNKEWLNNRFLKLIKGRYSDNKPTIITTNANPKNFLSIVDDGKVGRLASVLSEFSMISIRVSGNKESDVRAMKASHYSIISEMRRELGKGD